MTLVGRAVRGGMIAVALSGGVRLPAQGGPSVGFLDVGSERNRYMRALQVAGVIPLYPWTIRALAPIELDRLLPRTPPPSWRQADTGGKVHDWRGVSWRTLGVRLPVVYNTDFPYGVSDGAIWAGRGATIAVEGGFAARKGRVSVQLEPLAFDAMNKSLALYGRDRVGNTVYANEFVPFQIDQPQRFGNGAYTKFNLGQSSVRIDLGSFAAALSTANQFWGPAFENPIILGDNAAGFPHLFLGTSTPVSVGIGQVHGRLVYGRLTQTPYSPQTGVGTTRFMAGVVGVFIPRGVPGLELGASRFAHTSWPSGGILHARFLKPLQGVLGRTVAQAKARGDSLLPADNELGSLFFRWTLPAAQVEFFGEYGREDKFINIHDLELEPDHSAAYLFGLQRVWRRPTSFYALRAEVLNTRASHLNQARTQIPWYTHSGLNQGHTNDGEVLGAPGGFGGGGGLVAIDRYSPSGRWTLRWSRQMRAENGLRPPFQPPGPFDLPPNPSLDDVMYTWGVERLVFLRGFDLVGGVTGVWDLNRDFGRDQFDWNFRLEVRAHR